jgi:hypothetical protein
MASGAGRSGVSGGDLSNLLDHGELFSLTSICTGDLIDSFEDGVPKVLEAGEFAPLLVSIFTLGTGRLGTVSGFSASICNGSA